MTSDAEAQEARTTVTDGGDSQESVNGGQVQRPDVLAGEVVDDDDTDDDDVDDDDVDDEDAVIIEEMSVVRADDEASLGSADDGVSPPDADDEPGRDQVSSTPTATAIPGARRPGMPVGAGTPAGAATPAGTGGMPVGTAEAPVGTAGRHAGAGAPADTNVTTGTNMVGDPETLHERWAAIQSTFVDDPRGSVVAAAEFVTGTIAALVASAQEREQALRGEWDRDGVDTEALRNALRSYRGLLDRLVSL
jgi:hypothetical protein